MRTMRRNLAIAVLGTAALLGGCAKEQKLATVPPAFDELPAFKAVRESRDTSARVGVEHDDRVTKVRQVADYSPPPLTDKERAAVEYGKERVYDDDVVFLRRPRTAAEGVDPAPPPKLYGVYGQAGPSIGYCQPDERYGQAGIAGRSYGVWSTTTESIGTCDPRGPVAAYSWPFSITVGSEPARRRAAVASKLDY